MFFVILGIVLWVIFAFWPAIMARRKGYSFVLFFLIAIFISWLIALAIVLLLDDKNRTAEDIADDEAIQKVVAKERKSQNKK